MFSYRYMPMWMKGIISGTNSVSNDAVFKVHGFPASHENGYAHAWCNVRCIRPHYVGSDGQLPFQFDGFEDQDGDGF